jgi:hypothetical protein
MRRTALRLIATPTLTLLLLTGCSTSSPVTTYASRAGGTSFDSANSVTALSDGSAIVTGSFRGTTTFGRTNLISVGGDDVFVARVNSSGSWAWATRAGGTNIDVAYGVSALGDGGAIVAGTIRGTATFGASPLVSAGSDDVFVARINPFGTWAWAARAGGTDVDVARSVSALADGGAIVTGTFNGTATFGGTVLASAGFDDVFVARIGPTGTWAWAIRVGGTGPDYALGVSALGDGGAIVTGSFYGAATLGGTTLTSTGLHDLFVARIGPTGTWVWATRGGGTGNDYAFSVSALADGSAVVTGYFSGTATFGGTDLTSTGLDDVFVARTNPNGTWAWANRGGGTAYDAGTGVSALANGGAIVTGTFIGTATFGGTTLTATGNVDAFVARVDPTGTWAWAARAGGTGWAYGTGVSALADGRAIVTGYFRDAATFGSTTLTSVGETDVFVAKIDALGAW